MLKLKSARGQSLLASVVLLVLLGATTALAVWRAQNDQRQEDRLEQRTAIATALDDARAQFFLGCTLIYNAIFAEDPRLAVDFYYQVKAKATEDVAQARAGLVAMGETNEAVALDSFFGKILDLSQAVEQIAAAGLTADKDTRIALGQQYAPQSHHYYQTMMNDLEQLGDGQRSKLATERAAANRASDYTFGLLIGLSLLAFLGAFAMLGMFIVSLLRPLASLQASARAITSGNWEARAKVSGPEETASLARDFNEMTETLVERSALLEESEGRFRNVLEVSRDLIYKLNLQTRTYDYVSPSVRQLVGFTPQEIVAMGLEGVIERFHPEDRERLGTRPGRLPDDTVEGREAPTIEYRWQCKDGEYRWLSDNRAFVLDEAGRALALVGTVRDITEDRQAEAALRESEEKFRTLSASAPIGIFQTDMQARFTYVNEHLLGIHGVRLEELLGQVWTKRIHPDDRRATAEEALKAGSEIRTFSREYRILRPQGEIRWIGVVSSPVLSRDGSLAGYVGAAEDITERRQAEEALRESEEKYRDLFENANDLIQGVTPEGSLIFVNRAWREALGYSEDEIPGLSLTDIIHPDGKEHCAEAFQRATAGENPERIEAMFVAKDGRTITVEGNCNCRLKDGKPVAIVGIFRDVTERKRAKEVTDIERDLAIALNAAISLEETLRLSLEAAVRVSGTDCGGIYFVDGSSGALDLAYHQGLSSHFVESVSHYDADSPNARLVMAGEPVYSRYDQAVPSADEPGRHEGPRTIAVIPILHHGRVIACLNVSSHTLDEVPAASRSALETIASQIGAAIARGRAEEALRESEERFRSLSASAPIGIFLTDAEGKYIYVNERLLEIANVSFEEVSGYGWMTTIHPDDRKTAVEDASNAAVNRRAISAEFRLLTPQNVERWVHVIVEPMFSKYGKQIGRVGTLEDITERKLAEEAMATRLRMESAIAQASNLLAGPEDVDAALNLALRILGEAFGADRAHIFLLRDNNTRMDNTNEWCAPGVEPQINNLQDLDCAAIPWWMGKLAQNDPIIMTDTAAAPPDAALEKKSWNALNIHSFLAVPLLSDGKPIGYVRFANMESDSTERKEDIRLLRLASESIASFIERQRAGEEKRKAYESIVLLLATAAEARDPYTEDHLYRIRGFAEAIAAELGLPPDEIREIGFSSLLHDLGKMRVPDSILTKPGPLSQAEWKVMKQHPLWGEELLSAHPWLETARQIARWHHERWDGTGYPDGLRAEQIPLGAAIVTVADALDAMISERPYKEAWPQQQAVREIRMQKGRHFSPNVVEAFNRALRKGEIKRVTDATLRLSKPARAA